MNSRDTDNTGELVKNTFKTKMNNMDPIINKGNNKITELRAILQRESQNL